MFTDQNVFNLIYKSQLLAVLRLRTSHLFKENPSHLWYFLSLEDQVALGQPADCTVLVSSSCIWNCIYSIFDPGQRALPTGRTRPVTPCLCWSWPSDSRCNTADCCLAYVGHILLGRSTTVYVCWLYCGKRWTNVQCVPCRTPAAFHDCMKIPHAADSPYSKTPLCPRFLSQPPIWECQCSCQRNTAYFKH